MECLVNGSPIYYEEYGIGKPILCLHGFSVDHRIMMGCLEPIFQDVSGYRRIYIDLPGMGKSPANPRAKDADSILKTLVEFIKKVIGENNFLISGLSYGGYLSLGVILRMPSKIDGVLMICPCVVAKHANRKLPKKILLQFEAGLYSDDIGFDDFMDMAVIATKDTWQRYKLEILPGVESADQYFTDLYQKEGYGFSFEPEFATISFEKPACIITARQDDCVGYEDALKYLGNFSRASFVILDGCGHNLQIEKKALFNLHVRDWISRV